ncbi:MAG TPA: diguanylate cyclase [Anaerolineales bacterium]|nr:diguanylate cyclase [Anaerolineales bacterium]
MPPRFAAGHAILILGLSWVLYSTLTDHSLWEVFYTLLLLAVVSFLVVIGAAIHERDSARLETQGRSLAESSQRFTSAFDLAPNGMAMVATDGRLIQVNQALSGLVEYDDAALLTMTLADLIVPEERDQDLDRRAALLADEIRSYQMERQLRIRSGDLVWVILSVSLVRDLAARPAYFITHIKEIHARKTAEAALNESNARLTRWLSEMEQRTAEMAILNELGELLQASVSIEEALQIVSGSAQQLFPGGSGGLCVQGTSRASLVTMAEWGTAEVREKVFTPEDCWALRRGRAHLSPSDEPGRRCRHLAENGAAHLCMPLIAQGEPLGLLHLEQGNGGDQIIDSQRRLAQTVADNAALALANLRLRETLRNQSIRDTLTDLYNRRYLDETLERELHRAKRNNRGLGILMLDIDHFKAFNDSHGHAAGDAVLSALGQYLRRSLRASDIACRMGGEEFALILPDAEPDAVRERAEEIHSGLHNLNVEFDGMVLGPISISVGIAVFPVHGETPEELLHAADSAMYQAKRAGRDRVAEYAEPV